MTLTRHIVDGTLAQRMRQMQHYSNSAEAYDRKQTADYQSLTTAYGQPQHCSNASEFA